MDERGLWQLFFKTGRPEIYLAIAARRREAEGERLVMNGDAQTWFETAVPGQVAGVVEQIGRKEGRPAPARRWDRELARRLWRALFPLRPWLLRQMGRCGKLLRLLSGGERKR